MPKYYIKSGQIKFIIDRENEESAILDTLKIYKNKKILTGPKICISERGFESYKKWKCYDTSYYLKNRDSINDN